MPPKRNRPAPLFIALAVTAAHYNSGAPHSAEEVIAAKVICPKGRDYSDTFFAYTINKDGSVGSISQDFVKWVVQHTESPVCVVIDVDKFANTGLGRIICLSGCHFKIIDLASMASGGALNLEMVISITDEIHHAVADAKDGHIPPRAEVDYIVEQLTKRFPTMLPLSLRPGRGNFLRKIRRK